MRRLSIAVFSWLVFLRLAQAASDPAADRIGQIEKEFQLRLGVAAIDSKAGRRIGYRGDDRFPMCSTFKLLAVAAVLERVDRHEENLDRFIPYSQGDILSYAPVTKKHLSEGGMHLGALCEAASEESDNTAANLILQTIGGPTGWTRFARSIGDSVSRLDRTEPELNRFVPGDDRDTTTAKAMCADLDRLFTGDVLSVESRTKFETWLRANRTGDQLIRCGRAARLAGWRQDRPQRRGSH